MVELSLTQSQRDQALRSIRYIPYRAERDALRYLLINNGIEDGRIYVRLENTQAKMLRDYVKETCARPYIRSQIISKINKELRKESIDD